MPIRSIPNWTEKYYLLVFDKHGREVEEGGALLSGRIGADHPDATDIFVFMHGWKGDIPAAIDQYDRWISAMSQLPSDRALMEGKRPNGFRPARSSRNCSLSASTTCRRTCLGSRRRSRPAWT